MTLPLYLSLVLAMPGQSRTDGPGWDNPVVRLDIMKKTMVQAQVRAADVPDEEYRLRPEPIMRFTNTVGDTRDGAIFLWLGEAERPGAAVQVFLKRDGIWIQEWTSLSPNLLTAKFITGPDWSRRGAGLVSSRYRAPRPAGTPSCVSARCMR